MYWNSRKRPTSSGVCIYALSKIAWECWIYITYPSVHTLVFGGDFNEDLGIPEDSERKHRLKGLLQHCKLTTRETEGTIHVDSYWTEVLQSRDTLYPGLRYLYSNHYKPGVKPIAIQGPSEFKDVPRIHTKVKLLTGTYILQVNRVSFNQNQISPICLLCKKEDETTEHFILQCESLEQVRVIFRDSVTK